MTNATTTSSVRDPTPDMAEQTIPSALWHPVRFGTTYTSLYMMLRQFEGFHQCSSRYRTSYNNTDVFWKIRLGFNFPKLSIAASEWLSRAPVLASRTPGRSHRKPQDTASAFYISRSAVVSPRVSPRLTGVIDLVLPSHFRPLSVHKAAPS